MRGSQIEAVVQRQYHAGWARYHDLVGIDEGVTAGGYLGLDLGRARLETRASHHDGVVCSKIHRKFRDIVAGDGWVRQADVDIERDHYRGSSIVRRQGYGTGQGRANNDRQ